MLFTGLWAQPTRDLVDAGWYMKRLQKIEALGNRCKYCNRTDELTIDHIIPQALTRILGVDRNKNNLQVLCLDCNNRKGDSLKSNDERTVWLLDHMIQQWKFLHAPKKRKRHYVFKNLPVRSLTPNTYIFSTKKSDHLAYIYEKQRCRDREGMV